MKRFSKTVLKRFFLLTALAASFAWGALSTPLQSWGAKLGALFEKKIKEPLFAVTEHRPFVIVVPSYNNTEWVEKNLSSIFSQKYDNYRVIYINDASTDGTLQSVQDYISAHKMAHRVEVVHNEKNRGACENIYRAIQSCRDEEIAMILDGDDWFAHDRVLQRLNEIYADPKTWLTYGSYIEYPTYGYTVANFARQLPEEIVKENKVREYTRKHWCLSQLRTFYVSLFKQITREDMQWDGKFYDATYDLAFMLPMAEMAGEHAKYIDEIFYIYNRATPLNDNKVRAKRQQAVAQHILDLPAYSRLSSLPLYDAPPGLVNLDGHSSSPSAMDRSLGVSGTHPASRSITAGPLEDPPNSPNLAVRRIDGQNREEFR